jgi:hypothetical protein
MVHRIYVQPPLRNEWIWRGGVNATGFDFTTGSARTEGGSASLPFARVHTDVRRPAIYLELD